MKTTREKKAQKWEVAIESESQGSGRHDEFDELEEWKIPIEDDEISDEELSFMRKYLDEWEER